MSSAENTSGFTSSASETVNSQVCEVPGASHPTGSLLVRGEGGMSCSLPSPAQNRVCVISAQRGVSEEKSFHSSDGI